MATHDYVIDNSTGANVRTDLNNVLQAVLTNNSNSSSPSTTAAYMLWVDTTANIVKIRNGSNNAWINLFTTAGGVDVDAASTFSEDVTFTGASANIIFDKSDNALEFADNARAKFGSSADCHIYHNATDTFISNDTGDLIINNIGTNSDDIFIRSKDDLTIQVQSSEDAIKCIGNDAVELYFDNSKKLSTLSGGIQVANIANNAGILLTGTGNNTGVIFTSTGDSPNNGYRLNFHSVGTTRYGDEYLGIETTDTNGAFTDHVCGFTAAGLHFEDNKKINLGGNSATGDLTIFHDGTDSRINNTTGKLMLKDDVIEFVRQADDTVSFKVSEGGATEIYHNHNKKFESTTTGIHVTGTIGSQPPNNSTRGMSLSAYVVDINQAAQTVATAKINSLMGVALDLNRFYTAGNILDFRINNDYEGGVTVQSNGVSYTTTSDYRLKENEVVISDGITRLKQLKAYKFNFIAEPSVVCDGFFAHEVTPVVPAAVQGEKDATEIRYYEEGDTLPSGKAIGDIKDENSVVPQTLDYSKLVPLLTAALQESVDKIEVLETKVAALEAA